MGPQGLPLIKPPYGRITAYNMNTGDIVFQVANGDTYDWIKTHPALQGMTIPKTGQGGSVGLMVTKTLVVLGDPQVTSPPDARAARCCARTTRTTAPKSAPSGCRPRRAVHR